MSGGPDRESALLVPFQFVRHVLVQSDLSNLQAMRSYFFYYIFSIVYKVIDFNTKAKDCGKYIEIC